MGEPHIAAPPAVPKETPPLRDGERLDQKTFHERYEAMPPDTRAELIGGIVYMASPQKLRHGLSDPLVKTWLTLYRRATPGTDVLGAATTIMGDESEPEPDCTLIIDPARGGQTHVNEDEYLCGAPELVAELSFSSESRDLGPKYRDYEQAGVREYLVVLLRRKEVRWFVRRESGFVSLEPGADGIYHSEVFPGLWLDPEALLRGDIDRVLEVLDQGLATPDHARFVEQLRRP
jgi:hypothetical protein